MTNFGILVLSDLVSLVTVHPFIYWPSGIGLDEGLFLTAHYSLIAATPFLYPLMVNLGVVAYGELLGDIPRFWSLLFGLSGGIAGGALYLAGMEEAGVVTMLTAPIAGSMIGHHLFGRHTVIFEDREPSRSALGRAGRLLADLAGGMVGDLAFLATKLQVPVMMDRTGALLAGASGLFAGNPLEYLLFIPGSVACGVTTAEKLNGSKGNLLLAAGTGLLAGAAGWGVSELFGSDSSLPAHVFSIIAVTLVSFGLGGK
jgi:hypothetical protein